MYLPCPFLTIFNLGGLIGKRSSRAFSTHCVMSVIAWKQIMIIGITSMSLNNITNKAACAAVIARHICVTPLDWTPYPGPHLACFTQIIHSSPEHLYPCWHMQVLCSFLLVSTRTSKFLSVIMDTSCQSWWFNQTIVNSVYAEVYCWNVLTFVTVWLEFALVLSCVGILIFTILAVITLRRLTSAERGHAGPCWKHTHLNFSGVIVRLIWTLAVYVCMDKWMKINNKIYTNVPNTTIPVRNDQRTKKDLFLAFPQINFIINWMTIQWWLKQGEQMECVYLVHTFCSTGQPAHIVFLDHKGAQHQPPPADQQQPVWNTREAFRPDGGTAVEAESPRTTTTFKAKSHDQRGLSKA